MIEELVGHDSAHSECEKRLNIHGTITTTVNNSKLYYSQKRYISQAEGIKLTVVRINVDGLARTPPFLSSKAAFMLWEVL